MNPPSIKSTPYESIFLRILFSLLVLLPVEADPWLYEFTGSVSRISTDEAGLIQSQGLGVGTEVNFTWEVSTAKPGYVIEYDGSKTELLDEPQPGQLGNLYLDWFDATLIGGGYLMDSAAEMLRPEGGSLERHLGVHDTSAGLNSVSLNAGGVNYSEGLARYNTSGWYIPPPPIGEPDELPWGFTWGDPSPENWNLGDRFVAYSSAHDTQGRFSRLEAEVTLISVTAVPEPSTWGLLLVGLSGFGLQLVTVNRKHH